MAILFVALAYPVVHRLNAAFPDYHLTNAAIGIVWFTLSTGVHLILNRSRLGSTDDPYSPPTRVTR